MKWVFGILLSCCLLLMGPMAMLLFGDLNLNGNWRLATRQSAHMAPDPTLTKELAIIQIYAARAWHWRGAFAVHTWITAKRLNASRYKVYQVIGWRQYQGRSVRVIEYDIPDRYWFGQPPQLLVDLRGSEEVNQLIDKLENAAAAYPYPNKYRIWPGPNSNTFTAFIGRQVPELRLNLPPTAIGKDFLPNGGILAWSPSGTGVQFSLYGALGMIVGLEEGIEFNLLTLNFGLDPMKLAVKLPGIGQVGF